MNHDIKFVITTLQFVGVSGNSVSIDFPRLISEIISVNGSHFRNSTISGFFSGNFGKKFPCHVSSGAVHSTKNHSFAFLQKFPVANRTAFSRIPGIPLSEFPRFSVECFAFQKFNNFRIFWTLSQEIYRSNFFVFKFSEFLVEWTGPFPTEILTGLLSRIARKHPERKEGGIRKVCLVCIKIKLG